MKLKTSLNITKNPCLDSIRLPKNDEDDFFNKEAIISGYGSASLTNDQREIDNEQKKNIVPQTRLYYLQTRVIANLDCRGKYLVNRVF